MCCLLIVNKELFCLRASQQCELYKKFEILSFFIFHLETNAISTIKTKELIEKLQFFWKIELEKILIMSINKNNKFYIKNHKKMKL